eukprot:gnl/MRDRNA2_/MRDRNA2_73618_c0_seq2.p1 gnl/MRDRNA2_/MRDRNA2_73618_c0~~gnl/MRDRNA2_/MRDRNA2_73618_c0_seq2.p1  ORF type:complete len:163 (+),score=26.85 gnl/MRDRNA2_/MRDRNA2_73618_c0_seq2:70-558(+)
MFSLTSFVLVVLSNGSKQKNAWRTPDEGGVALVEVEAKGSLTDAYSQQRGHLNATFSSESEFSVDAAGTAALAHKASKSDVKREESEVSPDALETQGESHVPLSLAVHNINTAAGHPSNHAKAQNSQHYPTVVPASRIIVIGVIMGLVLLALAASFFLKVRI